MFNSFGAQVFGVHGWVESFPASAGFKYPISSPLAFPAGRAPGFDPSHLASSNIRLSAVPHGTNMISLLTGRPGVYSGAAVTKSITKIGPGARTGGWFSSSMSTFSGPAIVLNEPFTLAAIIMYDDVTGGMTAMRNTSSGSYGAQLITQGSMAVGLNGSVTIGPSGQSFVSVGRSYFVACSWLYGFGAHVVSTDLQSGKIVYEFMNSGAFQHLGGVGDPTCFGSVNGSYGPAMCSAAYMNKAQLLAWAVDPWSFWYPSQDLLHPYAAIPEGVVIVAVPKEILRPDADDSISDWTNETDGTTNLFHSIDETAFDDADYIKSPIPAGTTARFRLTDPTTGKTLVDPVIIRYRFKKIASDDQKLVVSLKQGTTLIKSWTHTGAGLTESFQTVEQTLSTGELATITDFDNLFIEFQASPP